MATHKADLTRLNLTQLAALVRCKPQTMRRKLDGLEPVQTDGRERLYDSADALSRYYLAESRDLSRERARLAAAQAEQIEMRNAQARRELVHSSDVEAWMVDLFSGFMLRVRALPSKLAPVVFAATSIATAEGILRTGIDDSLREIAAAKWIGPPRRSRATGTARR